MSVKLHRSYRLSLIRLRELEDLKPILKTEWETEKDVDSTEVVEEAISVLAEKHGVSRSQCLNLTKQNGNQVRCGLDKQWVNVKVCLECAEWVDEK